MKEQKKNQINEYLKKIEEKCVLLDIEDNYGLTIEESITLFINKEATHFYLRWLKDVIDMSQYQMNPCKYFTDRFHINLRSIVNNPIKNNEYKDIIMKIFIEGNYEVQKILE